MKQPDNHRFELIGERLRSDWREIETAPLPARITMLLEQLKGREVSEQAHRRAFNVANAAHAATDPGEGEGSGAKCTPMIDRGSRRLVLAEM